MKETDSDRNQPLPDRIRVILDQQPGRNQALIFQAIILALGLHIFFLSLLYFSTTSPESEILSQNESVLEEFDLKFESEEELAKELDNPGAVAEAMRDLVAGKTSDRTSEMVNYSGKAREQIEAEVNAKLYGLEKSEFDRLKAERSDLSEPDINRSDKEVTDKPANREDYDWFRKQSDKSYAGPVSAEFDLAGRTTRTTPRPTYRCKAAGKVVIAIEVDPSGNVVAAVADLSRSSADECIRAESESYARKWKFDYNPQSPKKQKGEITFTFRGQ